MKIFGLAAGPEEANPLVVKQPRSYVLTDKSLGILAMNGTIYNAHVDTGLTPLILVHIRNRLNRPRPPGQSQPLLAPGDVEAAGDDDRGADPGPLAGQHAE